MVSRSEISLLLFKAIINIFPFFFLSSIWLLEIISVYQPPIISLLTCTKANLIHCCELPVQTHLLSRHLTLTDLSLKTHFLGEEQGLLSVRVRFYHLATWQLTLATRTLNACNVPQKPVAVLPHTTWPYLLKGVTLILFVILRYLHYSREHAVLFEMMLKLSQSVHWSCYYNAFKLQPPQHLILRNQQSFYCSA